MSNIEKVVNFRLDMKTRRICIRFIITQDFNRYKEKEYYEKEFKLIRNNSTPYTYRIPKFQLIDYSTIYVCNIIDSRTLMLYVLHDGYYCDSEIISCEDYYNALILECDDANV